MNRSDPLHTSGLRNNGSWVWRPSLKLVYSDFLWGPNEPNNYNMNEYCVGIEKNIETGNVGYVDINCVNKHHFMCQRCL